MKEKKTSLDTLISKNGPSELPDAKKIKFQ